MNDMVKRVEKAIADKIAAYWADDTYEPNGYRDVARAAIEAMRLTEDVAVPGGLAFEDAFFGGGETVFHAAMESFNAVIDAALSPDKED